MINKFEQLAIIRDEILTDPNVSASLVWDAAKIAEEDKYLNDLLLDWMKSTNEFAKGLYLDEILNYTEEKLRVLNLANNR
jgi:hypothetical protein